MAKISDHVLFFTHHNLIPILCHVGFTIVSEQYSQTNFPIIKDKSIQGDKTTNNGGYLGQSGWRYKSVIILYCFLK